MGVVLSYRVICGDVTEVVSGMEPGSFDGCLCDPPYGLGFMGKKWDHGVPSVEVWAEVLRVLKPGGHLLAFGGTRTFHRLASAIEDAGFEIRDCVSWLYGSGFPKSHNFGGALTGWSGFGTALKPAWEPCIVAMKPLDGTFAENALRHGVAGLNIDAGRVAGGDTIGPVSGKAILGGAGGGWDRPWKSDAEAVARLQERANAAVDKANALGRWPANLILDAEAGAMLDEQTGEGPSRFFYCAKASRKERDGGLDGFEVKGGDAVTGRKPGSAGAKNGGYAGTTESPRRNLHPCLKPLDLNRYLASLILPPERDTPRRILVPFSGSGSEMIGALMAGWDEVVGIEREADYCAIAEARLKHNCSQPYLLHG